MQLKPPTRAKFSQRFMPIGECDSYCALIPGLPEDLAKICLALVPRSQFPVMGSVSKRWMSFLESKEFIAVRKEVGKLEEWVYVLTADAGSKGSHWEVLGCSGQKHSPLPPMPGPTKAGFGVVVLDGKLFVIAGCAADHGKECVSDEVYRYDSCLNRWVELSKMNVARCDFACAEVNGMIYVAGGFGPNGDSLSSVEVYDPEQNKWTLIESLRRPRWGCFACSFEGKLYVMGGRSSFTIGNSRFVDVYNPNNHTWGEVKNGCVMVTANAVLDKKLFCIEWKNQRSLAVFNPADNSWQKVPVPLTGSQLSPIPKLCKSSRKEGGGCHVSHGMPPSFLQRSPCCPVIASAMVDEEERQWRSLPGGGDGVNGKVSSDPPREKLVGTPSPGAKKPFAPPREVPPQVTHTLPPEKMEIFSSLNHWAEHSILPFLKPVEESWQPQDHLPDPRSESFHDEVRELRERAGGLPDDYLVCLVGDMVTEEALPTYQTMLNTLDGGVRDETGASATSWAVWTRAWAAEENRHGDLMNKYLYLTGRVDTRQVEKTIQYLIGSGMDPRTENDPFMGYIYTTFQERATFISHGNTARHAKRHGDATLARICGTIAADEKRHEAAYARIVDKLFEVDPDYTVRAFAAMMRKKVAMPAHLMYDGHDDRLFGHFSAVAQRLGVYTAADYAGILEFLVRRWNVAGLATGLSGEGRRAQDFVCSLGPRFRKLEERAQATAKRAPAAVPFSWIHGRQ
ncbi:hypothetical protein E2562_020023, partial [Oryza meyeriana var. granulata]